MNAFSLVIYDPFLTISSSNGQQCRVTGNTLKDTGHTTALPDIYCKTRWREIVTQVPLGIIWGYFIAFSASHVDVKLLDPKRRNLWAEIMIGRYSLGPWRKIRSQACVITIIKEMIRDVIEGQNVIFMEQLSQRPSARLGGWGVGWGGGQGETAQMTLTCLCIRQELAILKADGCIQKVEKLLPLLPELFCSD